LGEDTKKSSKDDRITLTVAYVITTAWAVSFLIDIIVPRYDPPPSVHALMMIVAGATFGEGLLRTRKKENGTEETKD
jgi:hypothetical protein